VVSISNLSVETRDTAIQILDNFLRHFDFQSNDGPVTDADSYVIDFAAAASVILSTKIHESKAKALSTVRSTMLTCVYVIYYGYFKQKEASYS
jgi:hypothetical protein